METGDGESIIRIPHHHQWEHTLVKSFWKVPWHDPEKQRDIPQRGLTPDLLGVHLREISVPVNLEMVTEMLLKASAVTAEDQKLPKQASRVEETDTWLLRWTHPHQRI